MPFRNDSAMYCFFVNFLCFGIANGNSNSNKTLHWLSNCRAKSAGPVSLPWNSLPRQVEVWEKCGKNPSKPPSLSRPKAWGVSELAVQDSCQPLGAQFRLLQKRLQQQCFAPAPQCADHHRRKTFQQIGRAHV